MIDISLCHLVLLFLKGSQEIAAPSQMQLVPNSDGCVYGILLPDDCFLVAYGMKLGGRIVQRTGIRQVARGQDLQIGRRKLMV